jgi:P27 family predicted phage terminase small subunit
MGRRGPKAEPASVKLAKGNPGRRRIGVAAETADAKQQRILAPDWVKDRALDIWNLTVPRLVSLKLLSSEDVHSFARYCVNYALWLKMIDRLKDGNEIYEIETAFNMAMKLDTQLMSVEDRFGLNPAERQRIFAARAQGAGSGGDQPPLPGMDKKPEKTGIHGFLN